MKTQNIRTFYTIILTQTLSLIGSRVSSLSLGIWLFAETGNATPLTLVAFFSFFPSVFLGGFAGVIADRRNRRIIMALSDAGQAVATIILLALFVSGQFAIWHLYLVVFIQALCSVFQEPAFASSITMLIPDEQRDRANALTQLSRPAAGIVAPVIAGFLFAFVGVVGAIILDLVTFLIAMSTLLLVHIPQPRKTHEGAELSGTVWQEMLAGLRFTWDRKGLFWLLVCAMVLNFVLNISGVLLTPYLLERTGSETAYGIILAVFNAGAIAGAITMSAWGGTRPRINTIIGGVLAMGLAVILFATAKTTLFLALSVFFIMFPNMFANISLQSIMQAKVAPDVQGRVFGAMGQLSTLLTPLAYLLAGPLADKVMTPMVEQPSWQIVAPIVGSDPSSGMALMFLISGLIVVAVSFVLIGVPAIRNIEADLPDYLPEEPPVDMDAEFATA